MADGGRFGGSAVLVLENATEGGGGVDLSVGSKGLRLELFQEAFTFVVDLRRRLRVARATEAVGCTTGWVGETRSGDLQMGQACMSAG